MDTGPHIVYHCVDVNHSLAFRARSATASLEMGKSSAGDEKSRTRCFHCPAGAQWMSVLPANLVVRIHTNLRRREL